MEKTYNFSQQFLLEPKNQLTTELLIRTSKIRQNLNEYQLQSKISIQRNLLVVKLLCDLETKD